MEKIIKCPKCRSNQIGSHKKGFSGRKAVVGALLTGGIGAIAGTIGSNDIKLYCLSCGHKFNPGEDYDTVQERIDASLDSAFWFPFLGMSILGGIFSIILASVFEWWMIPSILCGFPLGFIIPLVIYGITNFLIDQYESTKKQ